jgi:2-phosphoglycerate kinase
MDSDITIVKGELATPFSRGILAHTLAQAGADAELAHRIASEVQAELLAEERTTVEEEEVLARARAKLLIKDAVAVPRLDKWRILRESTEPIVVLIGGATGVGTSTLAADVARRLNIQSVIGTDAIREVLRRAISPDLLPILHKSSFTICAEDVRVPVQDGADVVVLGFQEQASQVAVGIDAIVERGLKEGTNLVVEGVHLAPEIVMQRYKDHPNVVPLVVYLSDEAAHRDRFRVRALGTSMRRPAEEYLAHFAQIRRIHDHILGSARRSGLHVIENLAIESTSDAAVSFVVGRVSEMAEGAGMRSPSLLLLDASSRTSSTGLSPAAVPATDPGNLGRQGVE